MKGSMSGEFHFNCSIPGYNELFIFSILSASNGFSTGKSVDRMSLYMFTVSSRFPVYDL